MYTVQWCGRNYLDLHVGKTKIWLLTFGERSTGLNLHRLLSEGDNVERVETYKYLGVLFDSALSWKQNTEDGTKESAYSSLLSSETKIFRCEKEKTTTLLQMFYSSVQSSVLPLRSLSLGWERVQTRQRSAGQDNQEGKWCGGLDPSRHTVR